MFFTHELRVHLVTVQIIISASEEIRSQSATTIRPPSSFERFSLERYSILNKEISRTIFNSSTNNHEGAGLFDLPNGLRRLVFEHYVNSLTHRPLKSDDLKKYRCKLLPLISSCTSFHKEALPLISANLEVLRGILHERREDNRMNSRPTSIRHALTRRNLERINCDSRWIVMMDTLACKYSEGSETRTKRRNPKKLLALVPRQVAVKQRKEISRLERRQMR
jgi:hypothetical protein